MASGIFGFLVGNKPKVPHLREVDPGSVQADTIEGNIDALPDAEKLASEFNRFSQEQLSKGLEFSLPGGLGQVQENISAQLRGEFDATGVIRSATAAGYGKGFGPSFGSKFGIGKNLLVEKLLLESMAVKRQGFQDFMNLAQLTKSSQFDFSSMFYTPQQRLSFEENRAEQEFNRDWLSAQIKAAAHPAGAFTTQLVLTVAGSAGKALGAAAGCWVAREVYGNDNPRWLLFRVWLYKSAPGWFRSLYIRFGKNVARLVRPFPWIKDAIRHWMDTKIEEVLSAD